MFRLPDEPTTPAQWQVIAWGAIVAFAVIGGVALWYAYSAPVEKADLARQVRGYGLEFWGLAAGVYVVKRVVERFVA